jgi:hypothetical protein
MDDDKTAEERRRTERFPMERQVRYRPLGRKGRGEQGRGTTINMSSRGVAFTTDGQLAPGRNIELSIDWPARLNENCALQFVGYGRVVRCGENLAAVEISRYEFRTQPVTRAAGPLSIAPVRRLSRPSDS